MAYKCFYTIKISAYNYLCIILKHLRHPSYNLMKAANEMDPNGLSWVSLPRRSETREMLQDQI